MHVYMISLSVFDKLKKTVLATEAIDVGVMRHMGGVFQIFGMPEAGILCGLKGQYLWPSQVEITLSWLAVVAAAHLSILQEGRMQHNQKLP